MKNSVIEYLNSKDFHVVEIGEYIFLANIFTASSSTNDQHFVKGKDITALVNKNNTFTLNISNDRVQQQSLLTSIETLKVVSKQFHKDFKFIYHLAY